MELDPPYHSDHATRWDRRLVALSNNTMLSLLEDHGEQNMQG